MIHETATVEEGARLGANVEIGPYAFVGKDVELHDGVRIGAHAVVLGATTLGEGVRVWPHAVVGCEPQDWSYAGAETFVRVGPRTQIREHVTVHRGSKAGGTTIVGADCMIMNASHVGHDCKIGDHVTIAGGAQLAGHVEICSNVFLSGNVAIHQFSWVGRLAMIGGLRRVPRDVPPFVTINRDDSIDGVNTVGLRRAGVEKEARDELVRLVSKLRTSSRPLTVEIGQATPRSAEAREFVDVMLNPRRRGWMPFGRRGR